MIKIPYEVKIGCCRFYGKLLKRLTDYVEIIAYCKSRERFSNIQNAARVASYL